MKFNKENKKEYNFLKQFQNYKLNQIMLKIMIQMYYN